MELFTQWLGFIGAWLLFAGPVYQAALELLEQDIRRDHLKIAGEKVTPPADVSVLWWFFPPIKLYLEYSRSRNYRRRYIRALPPEIIESLIGLMNKATAWVMVAGGGLAIAAKETYELCQGYGLNLAVFWVSVGVMGYLSILYTVLRVMRTNKIVESAKQH